MKTYFQMEDLLHTFFKLLKHMDVLQQPTEETRSSPAARAALKQLWSFNATHVVSTE